VNATLGAPDGVAVDRHKNVYVADDLDNEVRKIGSTGTISRIGGNGTACGVPAGCGNGGPAASAQLNYPDAVAVDPLGNVYVGDTFDSQLRLLSVGRGTSMPTSSGTAAVLAFEPVVKTASVTVRYLLSLGVPVTLSVTPAGGRPVVVARAGGRAGWGGLLWNRRISGAPAGHGSYRLTVTARVGGRSLTSSISVRL
jgi:hypothetical protein